MKKETKSYILNILKSEYFVIDLINMLIGIAVLSSAIIAFIDGSIEMFGIVFVLGATLSVFNLIKSFKRRSRMGIVVFLGLTTAMSIMISVIYGYFLR